ncbi:Zn-dependent protease with chaperone function [Modestobacter italicus]|uniref:Zn-dependent protease with chaperone function n=1 Tax=Modestobacter italicus (strain DSM 44449 / CECT 9708 / BC 501) TaxID=2732864 RepID=I4EZX1_MODI5|nr:M48 family metalloprotease [Modestobacter marinus]CCH88934.1 Zn-dependent protease with chaperone function [Modestobacter marinus]
MSTAQVSAPAAPGTRRAALAVAVLLGLALAVVIAVVTPWDLLPTPAGGRTPVDPSAAFTPAQIARAEDFAGALRPASLASLLLGLAVSAVFGLTRAGAATARAVARPLGGGWVWQVLLGTVAILAVGRLVTLPLAAYAEVVRHRYGLSTRGWGLWARDVATSTGIDAGLTALGLLALVALARRAPRTWWAWAGGAAAALVVVGSFLYPLLIEPAFNRFDPMPASPLRTELLALADRSGTPVQDVLVADASRRTTALNAYVSGFGSTRRIVVYDTVLDQLSDAEIESIAAHELGHVATDDVLTGTLIGALGAGAGVALLGWLLGAPPLLRRAGATGPGDGQVVGLLLLLLAVGTLVSTPVQNLVSRHIEARADLHALDLTDDPASFVAVQEALGVANLNDPDPPAVWQWVFGSHPTAAQRVAFAGDWVKDHGG